MAVATELTRRRVLIGAAWATPALLIATAVPAAAASGATAAVALASLQAVMQPSILTVRGVVAFAGAVSPTPDAPVSNVRMEISIPTSRAAAGAATFTGTGWSYTGRSTSGSNTIFTFTWLGANLSHTNTTTTQLVASIPKASSVNNLNVTKTARGVSNAVNVPAQTQVVAAVNAATMTFVQSAAARVTYINRSISGVGTIPVYRFRAQVRNGGVTATTSRPVAQALTGIAVQVEVPAAYTTGALYPYSSTSIGTGWTLTSGPTLSGGIWRLTYTYSGTAPTPGTATRDTTILDFVLRATPPKALTITNLSGGGASAGLPLTVTQVGPTV